MEKRTEFPNLAIVALTLRNYLGADMIEMLNEEYQDGTDKFEAVRYMAINSGEEEILAMLDYIERKDLVATFFP